MPLLARLLDNRRRAKARATLRDLLTRHQARIGHNAFPRRTSTLLVEGSWRANHEVFTGDLARVEGALAGVRQPKPRYQLVAVVALSEAIEGLRNEAPDSLMFFTLLSAHRELLQRTAADVGRGLIPDGLEERLLRWGIEVYNQASTHPQVKARYPALSLPLANKKGDRGHRSQGAAAVRRTQADDSAEQVRGRDDECKPSPVHGGQRYHSPQRNDNAEAPQWSAEKIARHLIEMEVLSSEQIAEATGLTVAEVEAQRGDDKG
ncbi:hypothetical protein QC758_19100 [Halomonas campisalis]|uniref:hypothetical protein n=1 Tax=Billgrantia campisalis TaxID=74661 RepID=UPI001EEFBF93|nr:hypothetical protein [Halomonas campisalis]MDR5865066.1 hypothetical protein [Halomonas campisalis]